MKVNVPHPRGIRQGTKSSFRLLVNNCKNQVTGCEPGEANRVNRLVRLSLARRGLSGSFLLGETRKDGVN